MIIKIFITLNNINNIITWARRTNERKATTVNSQQTGRVLVRHVFSFLWTRR